MISREGRGGYTERRKRDSPPNLTGCQRNALTTTLAGVNGMHWPSTSLWDGDNRIHPAGSASKQTAQVRQQVKQIGDPPIPALGGSCRNYISKQQVGNSNLWSKSEARGRLPSNQEILYESTELGGPEDPASPWGRKS